MKKLTPTTILFIGSATYLPILPAPTAPQRPAEPRPAPPQRPETPHSGSCRVAQCMMPIRFQASRAKMAIVVVAKKVKNATAKANNKLVKQAESLQRESQDRSAGQASAFCRFARWSLRGLEYKFMATSAAIRALACREGGHAGSRGPGPQRHPLCDVGRDARLGCGPGAAVGAVPATLAPALEHRAYYFVPLGHADTARSWSPPATPSIWATAPSAIATPASARPRPSFFRRGWSRTASPGLRVLHQRWP